MYLLAACALSFKPLFRMVAKALRLQSLITHTKSALGRTTHTNKTGNPTQKDVHMETFKSGSSGGFTKLSDGKDVEMAGAEEVEKGFGHKKVDSEGGIRVMVTRTVEMESERMSGEEDRYNAADQDEFKRGVALRV